MKYTIEMNGLAYVTHSIVVSAKSPLEALEKVNVDAIPDKKFWVENWEDNPQIQRIQDESGTVIACDYEDSLPDVDDIYGGGEDDEDDEEGEEDEEENE